MRKFEMPEIQVKELMVKDVITTSGCEADCSAHSCPDDLGIG